MPKTSVDEIWDPLRSWTGDDVFAHPHSPAGGGGPGSFRSPGIAGLLPHPPRVPHANSPVGRQALPSAFSREYWKQLAMEMAEKLRDSNTLEALISIAKWIAGTGALCVGVAEGMLESLVDLGVSMIMLGYQIKVTSAQIEAALTHAAKIFIEAEIYDEEQFQKTHLVLLDPLTFRWIKLFISEDELKSAHEERKQIVAEVERLAAEAPAILQKIGIQIERIPAAIFESYKQKLQSFQRLYRSSDIGDQYEAGRILGGLIFDLIMLLLIVYDLAVLSGRAAAAVSRQLAEMFPGLAGIAERIRLAARGARAVGEAEQAAEGGSKVKPAKPVAPESEAPEAGEEPAGKPNLDELYGKPEKPYSPQYPDGIKPWEKDANGNVLHNPTAQKIEPGKIPNLNKSNDPLNLWLIDEDGNMIVAQEDAGCRPASSPRESGTSDFGGWEARPDRRRAHLQ